MRLLCSYVYETNFASRCSICFREDERFAGHVWQFGAHGCGNFGQRVLFLKSLYFFQGDSFPEIARDPQEVIDIIDDEEAQFFEDACPRSTSLRESNHWLEGQSHTRYGKIR